MKTVTIVVPAYNEERHLGALLARVLAVDTESIGFAKEVIVIDDGSRDRTGEIARGVPGVTCLVQTPNQGKGRAVRRGIEAARGDYVLVQDADLEYDPSDYPRLLAALQRYDVVYGSRALGPYRKTGARAIARRHPGQGLGPWLASVVLTAWTWLLYGRFISDTLTGYKLYPTVVLKGLRLVTRGFETDHEITARLLRLGLSIGEVPIAYHPRSRAEGKKIRARDGVVALWTLLRFRFAP